MGHHLSYRGEETFLNQSILFLSLVERKLSQFVTFANWGLICWKWIVIGILSIKILKSWMYQKLNSYENKE